VLRQPFLHSHTLAINSLFVQNVAHLTAVAIGQPKAKRVPYRNAPTLVTTCHSRRWHEPVTIDSNVQDTGTFLECCNAQGLAMHRSFDLVSISNTSLADATRSMGLGLPELRREMAVRGLTNISDR
jgi:hypothetical protein